MVAALPADDADRAGEAEPSGPEVGMKGVGDITEGWDYMAAGCDGNLNK